MKKKAKNKKNNRTKKSIGNKKSLPTWEEIAEIGFRLAYLREIVEEEFEKAEQSLVIAMFKACEAKK